jgi:hypothetical protein
MKWDASCIWAGPVGCTLVAFQQEPADPARGGKGFLQVRGLGRVSASAPSRASHAGGEYAPFPAAE